MKVFWSMINNLRTAAVKTDVYGTQEAFPQAHLWIHYGEPASLVKQSTSHRRSGPRVQFTEGQGGNLGILGA